MSVIILTMILITLWYWTCKNKQTLLLYSSCWRSQGTHIIERILSGLIVDVCQTRLLTGQFLHHSTMFTLNRFVCNTELIRLQPFRRTLLNQTATLCCINRRAVAVLKRRHKTRCRTCYYPFGLWKIKEFVLRNVGSWYTRLWNLNSGQCVRTSCGSQNTHSIVGDSGNGSRSSPCNWWITGLIPGPPAFVVCVPEQEASPTVPAGVGQRGWWCTICSLSSFPGQLSLYSSSFLSTVWMSPLRFPLEM